MESLIKVISLVLAFLVAASFPEQVNNEIQCLEIKTACMNLADCQNSKQGISNESFSPILPDNITSNSDTKNGQSSIQNNSIVNMQRAIEKCDLKSTKELIKSCGNAKENFGCGYTFLHTAIVNGYVKNGVFIKIYNENCSSDLIKLFLEFRRNVNTELEESCNRSSPLHLSAQFNKATAAALLLKCGADIEKRDKLGRTPLYVSVEFGSIDVLSLLISNKANIKAHAGKYNWYPIHTAAKFGQVETLRILLDSGADIEQKSSCYRRKPVHQCAIHNQTEALAFLLQRGADVNATDLWGRSSIYLTVEKGYISATKILIDAGADLNSMTREHTTPITACVLNGHYEVFNLLIKSGVDYRVKSSDLRTVLHYASRGGNVKIVKDTIKLNPEAVNLKDERGKTPIYYAAKCGCFDVFEELLKNGADPRVRTLENMTILHALAENGNQKIAQTILQNNVTINAQDSEGQTALYKAAFYGSENYFRYLLGRGADPYVLTNSNETLLHVASKNRNKSEDILYSALEIFKDSINARDANGLTAIHSAVINGRDRAFEILLENGANPDIADNEGNTFLHYLAAFPRTEKIVAKILSKPINIEKRDERGRTPLYIAAENGNEVIFCLLMNKDANIHVITHDGSNLLHGATFGGNFKIVTFVLGKLENVNSQDYEGRTPLFIASSKRNELLFYTFLDYGADIGAKTYHNRSMLHAAVEGGNINITKFILKSTELLNHKDSFDKSAIFYAAERGMTEMFNLLRSHSADTSPSENGWTLLHSACRARDAYTRDFTIREAAVQLSRNVNAQDELGRTAIFVCAENLRKRTFTYLLEKTSANPEIAKHDGSTILHFASRYGDEHIAKIVLSRSERSAHKQDSGGRSPLHMAVYYNRINMVKILLKHHADVNLETVYGYTPLMLAAAMGSETMMQQFDIFDYNGEAMLGMALAWNNRKVISHLLTKKVTPTERTKMHFTAARGNNKELRAILRSQEAMKEIRFNDIMSEITKEYQRFTIAMEDEEIYITNPLDFRLTALDMAIFFNGSLETVEIILNASSNPPIIDRKRWSPLDVAAYSGKEEMVKFFLESRFPMVLRGHDTWSPVHKAAWGGHISVIRLLCDKGFDINGEDALGRTPLHVAALRGFKVTAEKLLQLNNASLNKQDRYLFTPLHLAEIYGHQRFYEELGRGSITMDPRTRYEVKDPGHIAGSRNHTGTVEILLRNGADPNAIDLVFGWTALHWAAATGDLQVARLLVAAGATVNISSKLGQTPLYVARFWGRKELYFYLRSLNGVW